MKITDEEKTMLREIAADIEDAVEAVRFNSYKMFMLDTHQRCVDVGASDDEARETASRLGMFLVGFSVEERCRRHEAEEGLAAAEIAVEDAAGMV